MRSIVGDTLRAARLRAHLTQVDVAHLIDIDPAVYSRLERGLRLPSLQNLYLLCTALRATPNELLGYPASLPPEAVSDAKEALLRRVRQLDAHQALALVQLLPDVR
ncbi:helix-turn-helix transcriptional regulator [Stigmatella aurantiaca]|uniref:helix-turn-helix transcriptional regulator n=1 Tax=Stigmatella aurantiaca TaxID=41 RepID=UPI00030078ED|nr:helix-turn-helix transcriptional regulator [Stigmatella aurantiaca]